ncbi:MAG: PKD domain-containing protein, partial [Thermoplasmatota archaeon]
GDGSRQDKVYAGSKPYIFRTDVSHSKTRDDILAVTMVLGSLWGQERITLNYFHQNRTFSQPMDGTERFAVLLTERSKIEVRNSNSISVYFYVNFKIPYPSEERRNVTVHATGKSAIPATVDIGDIYYVEDDIEWDSSTLVARKTSGDGEYISDGSYVRGGEVVQFSGFRVYYEKSDVQPPPSLIQINVTDNHGTSLVSRIPQGSAISLSWQALDITSVMTLEFLVYGIPIDNMVNEPEYFIFTFRVDGTPPGELNKGSFKVFPDQLDGDEEPYDKDNDIHYDNDDNVWLKWETITDGESGPGSYLIRAESQDFTLEKEVRVTDPNRVYMNTHLGENYKEALSPGRYNLSIRAIDIVGNIGPAIYTTLIMDKKGPTFDILSPGEGEWAMSARPKVLVEVKDDLSPIDGQTLFYRVSTNGGFTYGEWESFQFYGKTKHELELEIVPKLAEGKENMIQFKGEDFARSGSVTSQEIPVWVDQRAPAISMVEPLVDNNGTTYDWLKRVDQTLRIAIHDFKGMGVDPTRISYRYSLGGGKFSSDIPLEGEPYNNSLGYEEYNFNIKKDNWQEGDENLLVIDAWDLSGKNTTVVFRIRIDVTPYVELLSPDPAITYLDNETILFSAEISDIDGGDDISVSWMSNVDGPLSFKQVVSTYLSAGQHIITLTVDDGVHTTKRSFSLQVMSHLLLNPAFMDTDKDGMNDSYEMDHEGLDPNIKDGDKDLDGDGFTNLDEFYAGTDPTNKADYPGSEIKESKFPVLPLVLIILGLLGLIVFGALTVRESNKAQPAPMTLPPAYYGQPMLSPGQPPKLPALPPANK